MVYESGRSAKEDDCQIQKLAVQMFKTEPSLKVNDQLPNHFPKFICTYFWSSLHAYFKYLIHLPGIEYRYSAPGFFLSDKIMVLSFIDIPMYAIECFWHISVDIIPCFCLLVLITRLSLVNKVSRWNYISRSDYPKIISILTQLKNYVKIYLEGVPSLCLQQK